MVDAAEPDDDARVLLLAPTKRDAETSRSLLAVAGLDVFVCSSLDQLCDEIPRGAGVAVLPEECFHFGDATRFAETLRAQPSWSNLPVLILMSAGRTPGCTVRALLQIGDVSLLKRPLEVVEFLSTVQAAVRDRRRQYLVRDHLAEEARQAAALRDADRRKDEFLAMLAHELRNPLAPIRNGLQVLQFEKETKPELRRIHDMMDRQVQHLARLVDDLLDVSRITRGKAELRKERIDLNEAVARGVESVRPFIEARQHRLTVSAPDHPVWVLADLTRLTQVVSNLLNNAAKYSEPRSRIALELDAPNGTATIRVRDSGSGIAAEMLPKVFDLFTQVDRTLDRSQGGLGIGLTLVRSLVELHGGTVEAASDGLGKGSCFTVVLPTLLHGPASSDARRPHGKPAATKLDILVVDDNPDAGDSLALLLQMAGHRVAVAQTGPKALRSACETPPDVAVLDIGLPGMDGYELARRLRAEPFGPSMLLVALTGYGQDEDRRRTIDAGFDHHLTKPADPAVLSDILGRLSPR